MIKDSQKLEEFRSAWNSVRISEAMVNSNMTSAFIGGGVLTQEFIDFCHGLVVIFAYSVLEDTLLQMRDEKCFRSKQSNLKALMTNSRTDLPWIDFASVERGRERRNDIAHRRATSTPIDSKKLLDAIESELLSWRVLQHRVKASYRIEVRTID